MSFVGFLQSMVVSKVKARMNVLPSVRFETLGVSEAGIVEDFKTLVIIARPCDRNVELGRVVCEYSKATKATYIFDVNVSPLYERRGLATRLLREALTVTGGDALVPVNIVEDATPFWIALIQRKSLPIRFGVSGKEVDAVRICNATSLQFPEKQLAGDVVYHGAGGAVSCMPAVPR